MRRISTTLFLVAIMTLTVSSAAWAHTPVSPERVSADSAETFTVSTPGEKSVPIAEERVEIPQGFEVTSVSSPDGWRGSVEGGSVVWTGGEIGEGEEQQFAFEAQVPGKTGEYQWRAFDTYEDGSVSEWTGPPDSDNPASVTEIVSGEAAAASGHGAHGEDLPETRRGLAATPLRARGGALHLRARRSAAREAAGLVRSGQSIRAREASAGTLVGASLSVAALSSGSKLS